LIVEKRQLSANRNLRATNLPGAAPPGSIPGNQKSPSL
jgi:hypothetical protein